MLFRHPDKPCSTQLRNPAPAFRGIAFSGKVAGQCDECHGGAEMCRNLCAQWVPWPMKIAHFLDPVFLTVNSILPPNYHF